ncbi:MAG: hypothetical protein KC636_35245, partial [Myxococcales bacterium]|nr:hypothetical protein [Myxococcales bacterium]
DPSTTVDPSTTEDRDGDSTSTTAPDTTTTTTTGHGTTPRCTRSSTSCTSQAKTLLQNHVQSRRATFGHTQRLSLTVTADSCGAHRITSLSVDPDDEAKRDAIRAKIRAALASYQPREPRACATTLTIDAPR